MIVNQLIKFLKSPYEFSISNIVDIHEFLSNINIIKKSTKLYDLDYLKELINNINVKGLAFQGNKLIIQSNFYIDYIQNLKVKNIYCEYNIIIISLAFE